MTTTDRREGHRYARACQERADFIASEVLRIGLDGEPVTAMSADGMRIAVRQRVTFLTVTAM